MTTLVERAEAPTRTATLRTLAGIEARRYARHPLFLIGVALLTWVMVTSADDLAESGSGGDVAVVPAFSLGVLGVFVGFRLTRSMAKAKEAVQASPVDGVTRTAALCLACLVPGAVALVNFAWVFVAMALWPIPQWAAISTADLAAINGAGVLYAVGGPLFGVMIGRWTRFPGAGLVAAVALISWGVLAMIGAFAMSESRINTLVHLSSPYSLWVGSKDGADPTSLYLTSGSPGWHLLYITALCGLAATAAMIHEASGPRRSRLVRALSMLAILALVTLGLAVAPDPAWIPL